MKKHHDVASIRFEKHYLLLKVDGTDYRIDLRQQSKKLVLADERTKLNFESVAVGIWYSLAGAG